MPNRVYDIDQSDTRHGLITNKRHYGVRNWKIVSGYLVIQIGIQLAMYLSMEWLFPYPPIPPDVGIICALIRVEFAYHST